MATPKTNPNFSKLHKQDVKNQPYWYVWISILAAIYIALIFIPRP